MYSQWHLGLAREHIARPARSKTAREQTWPRSPVRTRVRHGHACGSVHALRVPTCRLAERQPKPDLDLRMRSIIIICNSNSSHAWAVRPCAITRRGRARSRFAASARRALARRAATTSRLRHAASRSGSPAMTPPTLPTARGATRGNQMGSSAAACARPPARVQWALRRGKWRPAS